MCKELCYVAQEPWKRSPDLQDPGLSPTQEPRSWGLFVVSKKEWCKAAVQALRVGKWLSKDPSEKFTVQC